jgi:hypothetical protein
MQRNKTIHIIEVFMFFFMQELCFEEFISFAALLLYMSIWNSQQVYFTILIRSR